MFPLMAQGHMIPMVDAARLLAQQGVTVSIVTTPQNAARFQSVVARAAAESKLRIQFIELQLPSEEAGLPRGCESLDQLPSFGLAINLMRATSMLQGQTYFLIQALAEGRKKQLLSCFK